jgi:hypothetical protein
MPLPKGTKYAMKKTKKGMMRLAFDPRGNVLEAKNMKTGAEHTMEEFKADRKKKKKGKKIIKRKKK